jgi:hypothetical protein
MGDFEHDASFEQTELSGGLQLDRYEEAYQELFAEALEDGVITADERARLERAAETMGLDATRLHALESALEVAYKDHHGVAVLHASKMAKALGQIMPTAEEAIAVDEAAPVPAAVATTEVAALRKRVQALEAQVHELETELAEAQAHVAIEVDLSEMDAPVSSSLLEEPASLHRRLRHDPRDIVILHALVQGHAGNTDRQWCAAHALVYLGEANPFEQDLYAEHKQAELIAPKAAVDATSWRRHLYHPEDEVITSDILSEVTSAVLMAQSTALKSKGQLPEFAPGSRIAPATSTIAAVRAFAWAAQTLGMALPALYAAPKADLTVQMVPTVPPACVLGKRVLSGRSTAELAFIAGQHLAFYRKERFIRLLLPDIMELEDVFLATLLIGNRALPLNSQVKKRVEPIAAAIEPLLEAAEIDRLRGAYQRFVEHGGRTNLQRWASAADFTAARAGLTLCNDLAVAEKMLAQQEAPQLREKLDSLLVFVTGDRYGKLREKMGIAIS